MLICLDIDESQSWTLGNVLTPTLKLWKAIFQVVVRLTF